MTKGIEPLDTRDVTVLRLLNVGICQFPRLERILSDRQAFQEFDISTLMFQLEKRGWVQSYPPHIWLTTEKGKGELSRCLQGRREHLLPMLRERFEAFVQLDHQVKKLCTAWQMKPGGFINLHDDPEYDFEVVEALREVNQKARAIFSEGNLEKEFELLVELDRALQKVEGGQFEYFTGAEVGSYHNLWFELHEDLLNTLGMEREG